MLNITVKKIYFTTHLGTLDGYENFNKSIDKAGYMEVEDIKT